MKKLVVLAVTFFGCSNCGVVASPPKPYFGPSQLPKLSKVVAFDHGCGRMFCSTSVSVWVELYNDKSHARGMTVECEYEVSQQNSTYHTTNTYKIPGDASRVLRIPKMVVVEKPQYGAGYVRCRHHSVEGISRWSKYKTFEVSQRYF